MQKAIIGLVTSAAFAAHGSSSVPAIHGPDSFVPAPEDTRFDAVCAIGTSEFMLHGAGASGPAPSFNGSGVLVAPGWVMTVGHILPVPDAGEDWQTRVVGPGVLPGEREYVVRFRRQSDGTVGEQGDVSSYFHANVDKIHFFVQAPPHQTYKTIVLLELELPVTHIQPAPYVATPVPLWNAAPHYNKSVTYGQPGHSMRAFRAGFGHENGLDAGPRGWRVKAGEVDVYFNTHTSGPSSLDVAQWDHPTASQAGGFTPHLFWRRTDCAPADTNQFSGDVVGARFDSGGPLLVELPDGTLGTVGVAEGEREGNAAFGATYFGDARFSSLLTPSHAWDVGMALDTPVAYRLLPNHQVTIDDVVLLALDPTVVRAALDTGAFGDVSFLRLIAKDPTGDGRLSSDDVWVMANRVGSTDSADTMWDIDSDGTFDAADLSYFESLIAALGVPLLGDVDGDGHANAVDLQMLRTEYLSGSDRFALFQRAGDPAYLVSLDADLDGDLDLADRYAVLYWRAPADIGTGAGIAHCDPIGTTNVAHQDLRASIEDADSFVWRNGLDLTTTLEVDDPGFGFRGQSPTPDAVDARYFFEILQQSQDPNWPLVPPYLDVDGNGRLDINDLVTFRTHLPTELRWDLSLNGVIDTADANLLRDFLWASELGPSTAVDFESGPLGDADGSCDVSFCLPIPQLCVVEQYCYADCDDLQLLIANSADWFVGFELGYDPEYLFRLDADLDGDNDDADYRACLTHIQRADLTTSSDSGDPEYGLSNGLVDAEDFFFYLDAFALGLPLADLTGSSVPTDPAYGVPDGVVDGDDFFVFLDFFVAPCP